MAIVTNITERAEQVLQQHGIRYEYGYGDAYHFSSQIPQKTSVDIAEQFALDGTRFVVIGETLQLEEEGRQKEEEQKVVIELEMGMVWLYGSDLNLATAFLRNHHAPASIIQTLEELQNLFQEKIKSKTK